jgi:hypothetical protein
VTFNQHAVYLTADGHVHELYYPLYWMGAQWGVNDLMQSAGAGALAAVTGSALTSWADPVVLRDNVTRSWLTTAMPFKA